jgi:transitional endoplasmic reticulum ATPase
MSEQAIESLRQAIRLSPENGPLRVALAEMLMSLGRAEEAEKEYRAAQQIAPNDASITLALANAFYQQGKNSHAMVIVEDLIKKPDASPKVRILYAKLLERTGNTEYAGRQYEKAVAEDASLADAELAKRLGVGRVAPREEDSSEFADGKMRASWEGSDEAAPVEIEKPKIAFKDVGGLEPVKEEVRLKIIHPLKHPELYKAYGKPIGGGMLLYGPPGCGKTYLARATAGEVNASFIAVGINDVLDMWIGNSEKNLHGIFESARGQKPCVLFFDEVDALAASRADMRTSGGRHLINQFLSELDGVSANNDGVLILAATNAPWHVDPAFRRPGRFDRILFVPPPDAPARAAILRALLTGKPVDNIDHDHVAKKTDGFSGADLKAVIDVTIEAKLRQSMSDGVPKPITTKDLVTAAGQVKPSTKEWFNTARNYALYANQGGAYDEILKYLKM